MSAETVGVKKKSMPPFEGHDYDEEVYLVVKRDIPAIQSDLDEIKRDVEVISDEQSKQSGQHDRLVSQVESLSAKVDTFRADQAAGFSAALTRFNELSQEIKNSKTEEVPWYKSFEKVLILLLVLGLGTLAGVKSYSDIIGKIPAAVGGATSPSVEKPLVPEKTSFAASPKNGEGP